MVTVVMHQDNLNVQAIIDFVWAKCKDERARFTENKKLPSSDEKTDEDVAIHVDGLMGWMVGDVHWLYKSERYFRKSGPEVRKTCVVKLLPKRKKAAAALALVSNVPAAQALSEAEMPLLSSAQIPVGFAQAQAAQIISRGESLERRTRSE
jgi:hypothetical protein